ncbi:hypothetical protein FQN49_000774, partial [Arthroderma sp. PD_2]
AGSPKETGVLNHIDSTVLRINRRHAKKFSQSYAVDEPEADEVPGYESFSELAGDVDSLLDLLWVTGTPSIQVPYMISLAGLVNSYLPDFPWQARSTFTLLAKMDVIFASLLQGVDVLSGQVLAGFEDRTNQVSVTEKVRIKSLVEGTRVTVFDVRDQEDEDEDEEDEDEDEEDEDEVEDVAVGRWEMAAARVYERTVQLLGDDLS